eukprot:11225563-Lingulodinium_polyedra.AAC.1
MEFEPSAEHRLGGPHQQVAAAAAAAAAAVAAAAVGSGSWSSSPVPNTGSVGVGGPQQAAAAGKWVMEFEPSAEHRLSWGG